MTFSNRKKVTDIRGIKIAAREIKDQKIVSRALLLSFGFFSFRSLIIKTEIYGSMFISAATSHSKEFVNLPKVA